jgi:hypothetical protein
MADALRPQAARRCVTLSAALVQCWNRITAARIALDGHHLAAADRAAISDRLHELCAQQDHLEAQMTVASECWAKLIAAEEAAKRKADRRDLHAIRRLRTTRLDLHASHPTQLSLGGVA